MNDRHRRVMRNMKRDDPKRYLWTNLKGMVSGTGMSAKAAIAIMTKKKRKPIKWHKHNKRWAK